MTLWQHLGESQCPLDDDDAFGRRSPHVRCHSWLLLPCLGFFLVKTISLQDGQRRCRWRRVLFEGVVLEVLRFFLLSVWVYLVVRGNGLNQRADEEV